MQVDQQGEYQNGTALKEDPALYPTQKVHDENKVIGLRATYSKGKVVNVLNRALSAKDGGGPPV